MPATTPTTVFPCTYCGTPLKRWPYRAKTAACKPCVRKVRQTNGRKRCANQTPPEGTTKVRRYRGRPYRVVYKPSHPNAPKTGWMMEHRLIMEEMLGRLLDPKEVVHHIDHNGLNNDRKNLELVGSRGRHLADYHSADGVRARIAGYPKCGCNARTAYGSTECRKCWAKSQTCPTCGRPERKMARRDMCHGCYKKHRVAQRAAETT